MPALWYLTLAAVAKQTDMQACPFGLLLRGKKGNKEET